MDNTKYSNTPARVMTIMAIAGAALVGGCGNSNPQDQSDSATTGERDQPAAQQAPADEPKPVEANPAQPAEPEAQTQTPSQGQPQEQAQPPAPSQGFTELGITDIEVGDGEAVEPGATVTVHYRGTFRESGAEFDSSYGRGQPAVFPLDGVIQGFSQGLLGMKVGGKRRVDIPWSMAYGERGRPPAIPARSDLVFDLELVAVENAKAPEKPELATEFEGEPQELDAGLVVRDIAVGTGQKQIKAGAKVVLHYRGVLAASGEQFDSSYDRGQPATFKLDPGALIEGFSNGLMGMKVGGKRRIEIPAALGYGQQGSPPAIPGNADLVFEVEVLTFSNPRELSTEWLSEETRENGLVVRLIEEGNSEAEPIPEDAIAVLHTLGVLEDGSTFDSTFEMGEPATVPLDQATIEGWKQGVIGMRPGEVRQIIVPPELAFGEEGQPPVIPANATLTFEVELIDWREPRLFSVEFASEPSVLEEGVTIREVKAGEGPEAATDQMAVIHYLAELPDGTLVANTFDTGGMQVVPLTGEPPLPGLRKGIVGMKVGGVRRIELSAEQAFGQEGNPPIVPPNTPIIFEVELMGVQ